MTFVCFFFFFFLNLRSNIAVSVLRTRWQARRCGAHLVASRLSSRRRIDVGSGDVCWMLPCEKILISYWFCFVFCLFVFCFETNIKSKIYKIKNTAARCESCARTRLSRSMSQRERRRRRIGRRRARTTRSRKSSGQIKT